jgi:hypothetical protein
MTSSLRNYIQFTRIMPENLDECPISNYLQIKDVEKIFSRPTYKFYFHVDIGGVLRFKSSIYGAKEQAAAITKSEMADIPGYMAPDGQIMSGDGKFINASPLHRVIGSGQSHDIITVIDLYDGYDFGLNDL